MEDTLETKKRKLPDSEKIEDNKMYSVLNIYVISVNIQDQNQLYIITNNLIVKGLHISM